MFITHVTQEIFILVFIRYLFFNFLKFFVHNYVILVIHHKIYICDSKPYYIGSKSTATNVMLTMLQIKVLNIANYNDLTNTVYCKIICNIRKSLWSTVIYNDIILYSFACREQVLSQKQGVRYHHVKVIFQLWNSIIIQNA